MSLCNNKHQQESKLLAKEKAQRTVILVNLTAGGGTSRKLWPRVQPEILKRFPENTIVVPFDSQFNLKKRLAILIENEGVNCFISAGGDGSVHHLLNALMERKRSSSVPFFLGGIGLGSSNDFHKPYRSKISGIPIRINRKNISGVDIGQVRFLTEKGEPEKCYFLLNASLGVTAAANHFFNDGDWILRYFKKRWTQGAIWYAALKTILSFRNYQAKLYFNDRREEVAISNLALLKSPHISGNLRYDQSIDPADGQLGLNYCDNMSKIELMRTLNDLSKGRFSGPAKRHSHFVKALRVEVNHAVPLEADGEVYVGKDFEFSLLPKAINLLGHGY